MEPNNVRSFSGFLLAGAALVALAIYLVLHGVLNPDEGFYLAAAHFVAQGHIPYRDFGYTQGPLLPYVNLPWLHLFGFTLAGQRLAALAWTLLAVAGGVIWLVRRERSWWPATLFVLLLLGSPLWLAFSVEGKTYGCAALAVLIGSIAVLSARPWLIRWPVFVAAATVGVGVRYPMAGFFVPAGICLLLTMRGVWPKVGAVLFAVAIATGAWAIFAGDGAMDRLVFWTIRFHQASSFQINVWRHFIDCFRFAPVLWIFAVWSVWRSRSVDHEKHERHESRKDPGTQRSAPDTQPSTQPFSPPAGRRDATSTKVRKDLIPAELASLHAQPSTLNGQSSSRLSPLASHLIVLGSLAVALVVNLSASTTYAEYVFPFLPAFALVVSPSVASWRSRLSRPFVALIVLLILIAGWNYPPELSRDVLVHAAQAEAFLRSNVPADATVACSMPEIPVASGNVIPLAMAMGKFGITEDMTDSLAGERRMLSPESLLRILRDPTTAALVGSTTYNWNFYWSLPSYRVLSAAARAEIWAIIHEQYRLSFRNEEYVIYLRKTE